MTHKRPGKKAREERKIKATERWLNNEGRALAAKSGQIETAIQHIMWFGYPRDVAIDILKRSGQVK